ncbi:hypothetical protein BAU15_13815 [Enterococcus sp. JM4C]|nr:hypothetical protein BAU15_13815 [Enterococcus sp. JM4C]
MPLELSFQISNANNKYLKIILSLFFVLFFPNIPYLVTDMIHMDMLKIYDYSNGMSSEAARAWLLIILLFLAIFGFVLIGFGELLKQIRDLKLNLVVQWLLTFFVCGLSSLGIYAGRFSARLHSVDFLLDPLKVIQMIFFEWSLVKVKLLVVLLFLHIAIIGLIELNRRMHYSQSSRRL